MLFAIDWIQVQLAIIHDFVSGLTGALTLDAIASFLTRTPALLVLYIIGGLALVLVGFRSHKWISSLTGGALMGYLGWQIGTAINANFLSAAVVWALMFTIVGLFVFYLLYAVSTCTGVFLVCIAVVRQLFPNSVWPGLAVAGVFVAIYCVLLIRRHTIRTSLVGGTLLGLIAFHYFGLFTALGVLAVCIAGGIKLQGILHKRYEKNKIAAREYRPNAPSPPTKEEIAAEIAQEEAEKAARQIANTSVPDETAV